MKDVPPRDHTSHDEVVTETAGAGDSLARARAALRAGGAAYKAALDSTASTRESLDPLIVAAAQAGMEPWEIEQLSHLSHQTVRNIRQAAGLPPASRGGARRRSNPD